MALDYLRRYVRQQAPESIAIPERMSPSSYSMDGLVPGRTVRSELGTYFVGESSHPAGTYHGPHPLSGLDTLSATRLAFLSRDPELAYADLSRAVFLDTETTGLNLGTGTYVFLVGAGYIENGHFRVDQFLLQDPGEELAFLTALDAFLRRFSVIITFNGKAFDWPLLEGRFVRHRQFRKAPLNDPPHIDLLHPARRFWKRRLESCALSSLEHHVLGLTRTGEDVPGWMIPSLYFSYVRSGDGTKLARVFYHNLQDILSLASLTIHMDRVTSDPMGGLVKHASDFLCIGKMFEWAGDAEEAVACFDECLRRDPSESDKQESLMRLAAVFKRERRWDAALQTWERLIELGTPAMVPALIERAKYYEHVEGSYLDALDDVQRALNLYELAHPRFIIDRNELEHRRSRLLNRIYRKRSWALAHE
ncbi:MAG: ribonuclease H-like domain-containing protein [Chloroflexota bacterium]